MSLLLTDIKIYFRQFRPGLAVAHAISRTVARIFDGDSATSYSQFGEDRVLPLFLDSKRSGFYVEVGANHPTKGSNTFWLYKRGWTGITIEPNPTLSALHRKVRPRDVQVRELVSDSEAELEFIEFENHLYSSASPEHVAKWEDSNVVVSRRKLKPLPLTRILDARSCPTHFDLLCVDAEGADLPVLRSLDWSKYHPGTVIVEMSDYLPGGAHPILAFMESNHYALKAFDGFNGYFQPSVAQANPAL